MREHPSLGTIQTHSHFLGPDAALRPHPADGQQARLQLELLVEGAPGRPGLCREATLERLMVSEATAAVHLLMDGPAEGLQA